MRAPTAALPLRRRLAGLLLAALAAFAAPAAVAGEAGETLMRIEKPEAAIEAIRALPADAEALIEVGGRRDVPAADLEAARTAVAGAFDEADMLAALRRAVGSAGGGAAQAPGLAAAAGRFAETETEALGAGGAEALQARFEARPDRARIETLAELMAMPELRGEVSLTRGRVERMMEIPHATGLDRLAEADGAALAEEARRFVADSRVESAAEGGALPHVSRGVGIAEGKAMLIARLARLEEADVEALHAFYSDAAVREAREALVSRFAAESDARAEAMLLAFLDALRARPR